MLLAILTKFMSSRFKLGVFALVVVVAAAALMQRSTLSIAGIAPNLLLVSLIIFSFFSENAVFYAALVFVGVLFGRASPAVFDPFAFTTAGLCLGVFWLQQRMVWPGLISAGTITAIATVLTYIVLSPAFLWQHSGILLAELLYNVVLGLVLFEVIQFFFGRKFRD